MQIMNKALERLWINEIEKREQQIKQLQTDHKFCPSIKSALLEEIQSLKSQNEKLQKVIDEIRKIFQTYRDDNLYDFDTFNDEANAILKEVEE